MKNDSFRIRIDVKFFGQMDTMHRSKNKKSKFKGLRTQVKCCFIKFLPIWGKV